MPAKYCRKIVQPDWYDELESIKLRMIIQGWYRAGCVSVRDRKKQFPDPDKRD
ncbi:MAG: hypothetical protein WA364_29740 [Candidatus Nitrosopolaris sp.]